MLDIAIVGAGPYGLSIAAHLAAARADFRIFGEPLSTWRHHMPAGMLLKSDGFASNLSGPDARSTLKAYCALNDIAYDDLTMPVSLKTFVAYGLDFQRKYVPNLEEVQVKFLERSAEGYRLHLETGELVEARRVLLAVGITHYDQIPEELTALPRDRVSHSSAYGAVDQFAGLRVAVLGSGSSAVDLAAALEVAGAKVQLIARKANIKFRALSDGKRRSLWQRVRHPTTGLGAGLRSWLCCEFPQFYRVLPESLRMMILARHLGPSSPGYMREKIEGKVETLTGRRIVKVESARSTVRLALSSAEGRIDPIEVDHVICATGYSPDLNRLTFLDDDLRRALRRTGGAAAVSTDFESSAPGLYFVGVAAAPSFGPLMRFMYGAEFAAPRIARRLLQTRR